jgi:hypothetical protein
LFCKNAKVAGNFGTCKTIFGKSTQKAITLDLNISPGICSFSIHQSVYQQLGRLTSMVRSPNCVVDMERGMVEKRY